MNRLTESFSEFRKTTPKYVQWLLLAAAFVVVLILLTLLMRGGGTDDTTPTPAVNVPVAEIAIAPDTADWSGINVGDTVTQTFIVSATGPVRIDAVRLSREVDGLFAPRTTCVTVGQINPDLSCSITLEYAPTFAADTAALAMFVDWRPINMPVEMTQTARINIAIGAMGAPVTPLEQELAQLVLPDPIVEPVFVEPAFVETVVGKPEPVTEPIIEPAFVETVVDKPEPTKHVSCSDFAFPGYNASGTQIGWIRPVGGAYRFHPFSDIDCNAPTGTYNPDNGIITDAAGKKIGTDAEHIGFATNLAQALPTLSNPTATRAVNRARQLTTAELATTRSGAPGRLSSMNPNFVPRVDKIMTSSGDTIVSSAPYDRTFILRQYKPIPATIVSEIRAEQKLLTGEMRLPVIATVDRNVYSDNGRTVIVPTGTTLYGYVTGDVPGPYKAIGRMNIEWYQFVRPDGVEFNFAGNNPFSGDAQGRAGVPGRGSTDYIEQFVMPMLTAIVPAAVNMIAPISDRFINQIDLDNNTVTQSGQVRSSELAKNEIITAWNKVAQKLLVDIMDNTVPPFSISAGTRINVFSPVDLLVTCGAPGSDNKNCAIAEYGTNPRFNPMPNVTMAESAENMGSMIGQVRSFDMEQYCARDTSGNFTGGITSGSETNIMNAGYDYRTVLFFCQSAQYTAINNAKQAAVFQNQQQTTYTDPSTGNKMQIGSAEYNQDVLGLEYNADGTIKNPFTLPKETPPAVLTCPEDGALPDANGCCTGETYTDMGEQGFNCCPASGGDCFPPMI